MYCSLKTNRDNDVSSQDSSTSYNNVSNKQSFICKSDRKGESQLSTKTSASLTNNPSLIKEQIQEKYR